MRYVNLLCSYVGVVFIVCLLYTRIFRQKKMLEEMKTEE